MTVDWQDFISPVSGVAIAAIGLWKAQTIARNEREIKREEGAAAVVPQLRERLDAQDKKIDELREEVEECEKRSALVAQRLADTQGQLERALVELEQARMQLSALLSLLPARDRDRVVSYAPPPMTAAILPPRKGIL